MEDKKASARDGSEAARAQDGGRVRLERHRGAQDRGVRTGRRRPEHGTVFDTTEGANYLVEIKDSVAAGFHWASKQSVLRGDEEPMRGIPYNPMDVTRHARGNTVQRGRAAARERMDRAQPLFTLLNVPIR